MLSFYFFFFLKITVVYLNTFLFVRAVKWYIGVYLCFSGSNPYVGQEIKSPDWDHSMSLAICQNTCSQKEIIYCRFPSTLMTSSYEWNVLERTSNSNQLFHQIFPAQKYASGIFKILIFSFNVLFSYTIAGKLQNFRMTDM